LQKMDSKWKNNINAKAETDEELRVEQLLNQLKVILKDLRGSNGQKLKMCNEIWALLKTHGCPALFITV
ncbi:hypothetical protein OF83DRAFT_1024787, partial [Amylostereum chailletii]